MTSSAHRAKQFAADVAFSCLAVAHDAFAGADDGDAHAVENPRQVADAAVNPPARLRGTVQGVDHLLAAHRILELHAELALAVVLDGVEVLDVALVLKHLGDAGADLASGDEDQPSSDPVGIPDTG